jgi:hypothetical protein
MIDFLPKKTYKQDIKNNTVFYNNLLVIIILI